MNPSRGEVWLVDLGMTVADEMRKTRPAVVVSADAVGVLELRVVVPLTGWQPIFGKWPWMTLVQPDASNRLTKDSAADAFQVRSVSVQRLVQRIGRLSDVDLGKLEFALRAVLKL